MRKYFQDQIKTSARHILVYLDFFLWFRISWRLRYYPGLYSVLSSHLALFPTSDTVSLALPWNTESNGDQSLRSSNIAELSPGAINSCRSEYHAAFNSMMMERMTTDIHALKRQYSRIKKKQQQQAHQVYIRAGNVLLGVNFSISRMAWELLLTLA